MQILSPLRGFYFPQLIVLKFDKRTNPYSENGKEGCLELRNYCLGFIS